MAKDLSSTYTPGVRGKSWLKLKHVVSLDLVVVAADWGYGRRHGWLSNYHLAVRDTATGAYHVVGKTYKGLTDDEFRAMTKRLLDLQMSRAKSTVYVQPTVVVEVLFNEIQRTLHTIKSAAMVVPLEPVSRCTHLAESLMESARADRSRWPQAQLWRYQVWIESLVAPPLDIAHSLEAGAQLEAELAVEPASVG